MTKCKTVQSIGQISVKVLNGSRRAVSICERLW